MNDLDRIRARLLDSLPPYEEPGPRTASTVYVWPTAVCRVGCDHCNFASPASSRRISSNLVANNPEQVLAFVADLDSWKVVLSGGGEPFEEVPFVLHFVEKVTTPQLAEIEIITSGMFAATEQSCLEVLEALARAFKSHTDPRPVRLTLRLSVDWFHVERIGLEPIANILRMLSTPQFSFIHVYIRSVLVQNDTTLRDLADLLGGTLTDLIDFQQHLILKDGRRILAYSKNLIVDGRLSWRKLRAMGLAPDERASAENFTNRFRNDQGFHVPGRVYNGPQAVHLPGLALIVEHDGSVKILEGTAPDRVPSLFERSWDECLAFMYRDPLTVYLLEQGPEELAALLAIEDPRAPTISRATNQLYYLADKMLATSQARLIATQKVLEFHRATGRYCAPDSAFAMLDSAIGGLTPSLRVVGV